jgi:hypothetical protein
VSYEIVRMRVKGMSGLLMHNPQGLMKAAGADEAKPPPRGSRKIDTPEVEARRGLYRLPDGQLYVPADAFREAALTAAADIRDPAARSSRTMMTRRFASSVFLSRDEFPLFRQGEDGELGKPITDSPDDWTTYTKRVVIKGNGVMRGRARVADWMADLEFEIDNDLIDGNLIATIVGQSGRYPGILDYRVGKKGPFGRFEFVRLLS